MLFAKEAVEKREYTKRKAVVVAVKGAEPDADAGAEGNLIIINIYCYY